MYTQYFKNIFFLPLLFIFSCSNASSGIEWNNDLKPEVFEKAKQENKIILLNLEANWCHWCHVMHDSTYSNSSVIDYLNEHYILVKADQDANPDLSARYKDYGWPATIFINAKGDDVVKRAGYIAPNNFLRLLKAIVKDPSPETTSKSLTQIKIKDTKGGESVKILQDRFENSLDFEIGGFNQAQKYIAYGTYEYAMYYSQETKHKSWVKTSVAGAHFLVDPVWGGAYQYSTHYDWNHLHFEKLLSRQARYINIFLDDALYHRNEVSLKKALSIYNYVERFLAQEDGLYANAQDADLVQGQHSEAYFELNNEQRLKLGIPNVDENTYTENNAMMVGALLKLHAATQEKIYFTRAKNILNTLLKRKASNGFFEHKATSSKIYSLKNQLEIALALKEMISFTNDENYKKELADLIENLTKYFLLENGSAKSYIGNNGLTSEPIIIENIKFARLLNWYSFYANNKLFKAKANKLYLFLTNEEIMRNYYSEPAILSLSEELKKEPNQYIYLHNDSKNLEPADFGLKAKAMAPFFSIYNFYTHESLPENKKELFEGFEENVIFICTSSYCSSPIFNDQDIDLFFSK